MIQNLKGKTAIVTASTDGIGLAAARRLAEDGAKVWISSRKEDNVVQALDALKADGLNVNGLVCHVSKQKDREILFNSGRVFNLIYTDPTSWEPGCGQAYIKVYYSTTFFNAALTFLIKWISFL